MHAYRTSVHESTGYSPFRLMMGEECSLPHDVSTSELRTNREHDISPHPFATWVRDAFEVAYDHVRESLHRTTTRRKWLYDVKAVNRKFPVGSWVLRYYPPAAQHKLGSPWIGPNQVVRQATGHIVGIQKGPENLLCLFMWTIWNSAQPHETSHGIPALRHLNHYVPVQWLSDRVLILVTLPLHRQWIYQIGMRWTPTIL